MVGMNWTLNGPHYAAALPRPRLAPGPVRDLLADDPGAPDGVPAEHDPGPVPPDPTPAYVVPSANALYLARTAADPLEALAWWRYLDQALAAGAELPEEWAS